MSKGSLSVMPYKDRFLKRKSWSTQSKVSLKSKIIRVWDHLFMNCFNARIIRTKTTLQFIQVTIGCDIFLDMLIQMFFKHFREDWQNINLTYIYFLRQFPPTCYQAKQKRMIYWPGAHIISSVLVHIALVITSLLSLSTGVTYSQQAVEFDGCWSLYPLLHV